ncbi:GtrA family protein [Bacillus sp. FSL W7-1360]
MSKFNRKTIPYGEICRFILVGGTNTVIFYGLYLVFTQWLLFHYMVSHVCAFLLSMVVSYFLNVFFTFNVRPSWKTFFQFPLTQVVNLTVSSGLVYVLVEWIGLAPVLAPIFAVFFTVPITFIMSAKILKQDVISHEQ